MKPTKSILDPTFEWIPAACTDLRKTFRRVRARMVAEQAKTTAAKVTPIRERKA